MVVDDDGVGGADIGAGTGLRGLKDRLAALEGSLRIDSPDGGGTRLRARIPCGATRLVAEAREVHLSWRPPPARPARRPEGAAAVTVSETAPIARPPASPSARCATRSG